MPRARSSRSPSFQRRQEHGAVRRPACNDSVSPLGQAVHDGLPAEVDVGVHQLILDLIEVAHVVHILELAAVDDHLGDLVQQVVAGDIADLVAVHALLFGHRLQGVHRAGDVHAAGVGDDADLFLVGLFAHHFHQVNEVPGEACRRILHPLPLHDGQRQLRQVVAGHVVQIAMPDHVDRRVRAIAPESLAAAN